MFLQKQKQTNKFSWKVGQHLKNIHFTKLPKDRKQTDAHSPCSSNQTGILIGSLVHLNSIQIQMACRALSFAKDQHVWRYAEDVNEFQPSHTCNTVIASYPGWIRDKFEAQWWVPILLCPQRLDLEIQNYHAQPPKGSTPCHGNLRALSSSNVFIPVAPMLRAPMPNFFC